MPEPIGSIANLHELLDHSAALVQHFKHPQIWWRGHGLTHWTLTPGVHRDGRTNYYERNITLRFFQKARTRHHGCPPDTDVPGWLFLMQHYRLPTRLLDWTESCLIAAFFAATDHPQNDGALWVLDPFLLNQAQRGQRQLSIANADYLIPLFQGAFQPIAPQNQTLAIVAPEVDIRMLIQQSAFTLHGDHVPLESLPTADTFTRKFAIPAAAKQTLKEQLAALGIRASTLFPDLEHLALDLSQLPFEQP